MTETVEERRLRLIEETTPLWRKEMPDEELLEIGWFTFRAAVSEFRARIGAKMLNMDITLIADEVYEEMLRISAERVADE